MVKRIKYFPKKSHNVEFQVALMKRDFPQFKPERNVDGVSFIGELQVKPELPKYKVKIEYRGDLKPRVSVLSPALSKGVPHVYEGGYLCLYHPDNYKWNGDKFISKEIVQWTCAWLYFYEYWLQTGEWVGPEVPHSCKKEDK